MSIIVNRIFANNKLRNNQFLIRSDRGLIVIDPYDGEQVQSLLNEGEQVHFVINTHGHFDHTRGNDFLKKMNPRLTFLKQALKIEEGIWLKPYPTPGHTFDSVSWFVEQVGEIKQIFVGDTLFVGGVGNCYNGGEPNLLARTLNQLDDFLYEKTKIFVGHDYRESNYRFVYEYYSSDQDLIKAWSLRGEHNTEYETSWAEEKRRNPFLKVLFDREFYQRFFPLSPSPQQAFTQMRELKDQFS